MKFSLQTFKIKRLRGYQGYQGYRGYDGHQGVFTSSNTRLRGYGVTSLWKFFLQFFRTKRLRGYQSYQGYRGYNGHQIQDYEVTGLPTGWIVFFTFLEWKGYEVTQVTEVTQMFFLKIKPFFRGYEVTGLRRLQGYEIAKSSIYLATTVWWSEQCYNRQKLLKQNLSDILHGAMFKLEGTTFRPYGPTMAILDPKIAKFGLIWP